MSESLSPLGHVFESHLFSFCVVCVCVYFPISQKQWQEAREYVQQHAQPQERLVIGKDNVTYTLCRTLTQEGLGLSLDNDDEYSEIDSDEEDDDNDDNNNDVNQVESFQRHTREACELATFLMESYAERRINPSSSLGTHHGGNGRAVDILLEYDGSAELLRVLLNIDADPWPVQAFLSYQNERSRTSAVHYAAEGRCSFSIHKLVMDLCVQSDPRMLLMLDRDMETPLHWAMQAQVSQRRMQLYIRHETAPLLDRLLSVPNNAGFNPLQLFWREAALHIQNVWSDARVVPVWYYIEMLTETFLKAKGLEYSKDLPVHGFVAAFTNFCHRGLMRVVLFVHNVADVDENGLLALHIACMCPALDPSIISDYDLEAEDWDNVPDELVKKFPETASVECPQTQRLPLHWALERRAAVLSLRLVTKLVGLCPAVLLKADPVTGLGTFMLAAASAPCRDESARLDVIYYLLRSEPSILTALGF